MVASLKKLKTTKIWRNILLYLFSPVYSFIWKNVINFHGRILYFYFLLNKKNDYSQYYLKDNDKKILRNIDIFKNISADIKEKIDDQFIEKLKLKINERSFAKDTYMHGQKSYKINMWDDVDDELREKIFNFALNEFNISIISNYLGVLPTISRIYLTLNVPVEGAVERGPMLWHRDGFGYKSLDLFLPIIELTEENGPFFYLNEMNKLGVLHRYSSEIKNALKGERNKIEIKAFENNKQDKISYFTGKTGDAIFVDSFNCYHRGGYCKSSDRIMLRITYQTPDARTMKNTTNLKNFSTINNTIIRNLGIINNHIVFKRSKLLSKLNLQEKLVKFYNLIHYKDNSLNK